MAKHVVSTAVLQCTFGAAPSSFTATPKMVKSGNQDAGNIMDHVPMVNIKPFGPCSCPSNPQVAAATAAAAGVLTPQPCIPNTPAPWITGAPDVLVNFFPALNDTAKLMCVWGGVITVKVPGQFTENIPS